MPFNSFILWHKCFSDVILYERDALMRHLPCGWISEREKRQAVTLPDIIRCSKTCVSMHKENFSYILEALKQHFPNQCKFHVNKMTLENLLYPLSEIFQTNINHILNWKF